jgi:aerobic carbon-monoxide dehydrogenase small subunit
LADAQSRVTCTLNGQSAVLEGHPMTRLLDAIRHSGLTGTKEGCGEGECGACGVLLDGELVNSCLTPLAHAEGASIVTIEGIATDEALHTIQESFLECGGAQCGICTPGMVLAAYELLSRNTSPSEEDVRVALAGNLCRCTGYMRIFDSVLDACRKLPSVLRA